MTRKPPAWPSFAQAASAFPAEWLQAARWFRRKSDPVREVHLLDALELTGGGPAAVERYGLLILNVVFQSGQTALYQMPVRVGSNGGAAGGDGTFPAGPDFFVQEATSLPAFNTEILRLMETNRTVPGVCGTFHFESYPLKGLRQCEALAQTSSNSLVLVRGGTVMKYLRGLDPGISPELEMNRFFATHGDFTSLPPLTGSLTWRHGGEEYTLAIAQGFIANEGDLWSWTLDFLKSLLNELPPGEDPVPAGIIQAASRHYLQQTGRLARLLARMHHTLASGGGGPAFAPEPVTSQDLQAWGDGMIRTAQEIFGRIGALAPGDTPLLQDFFRSFPSLRQRSLEALGRLSRLDPHGWIKCRVHGDFHLGQALKAGEDFYIIDFEGEPLRAAGERTVRYSPLKDVAGLLRSYNYAVYAALFAWQEKTGAAGTAFQWAEDALLRWNASVEKVFWSEYLAAAGEAVTPGRQALLAVLKLEKAIYELDYEINNRPAWLKIPVSGIGACLAEVLHES